MGDLDRAWAAAELDGFRTAYRTWKAQEWRAQEQIAQAVDDGWGALQVQEQPEEVSPDYLLGEELVLDRILPLVLRNWTPPNDPWQKERWALYAQAATRAIPLLRRAEELDAKIGDGAPTLDAGHLHPWVWEGARSLWQSGHYREAVTAAARKLNAEAQNKLTRRDVSETDLFNQAFSNDEPKAGQARLRLPEDDGGKSALSVRQGLRAYAQGCFAAIRNPASHDVLEELPEHEALEQLAAFSVLARWVDRAQRVTASPDTTS